MESDSLERETWGYGQSARTSLIVKSALGALFLAFPTFAGTVFIHFEMLHLPPPADPMWPVPVAAILGSILIHFIPLPARRQRIEWNGHDLLIIDSHGRRDLIDPRSVSLIAGECGLAFDGGNLIVWKRVHLTTNQKRYSINLQYCFGGPEACFKALSRVCPNAVCISAWGKVQLGAPAFDNLPDWLGRAEKSIKAEFRRQSFRAFIMGIICAIGAGGLAAVVVAGFRDKGHEGDAGKAALWAIMCAVASLLLLSAALRRMLRGRRISLTLRAAMKGHNVDPAILDKST
jgi:hypothetical protein